MRNEGCGEEVGRLLKAAVVGEEEAAADEERLGERLVAALARGGDHPRERDGFLFSI